VAFANGASGMEKELVEGEEDWVVFRDGLTEFAEELAKLVVRDGEGATKFVTVTVKVSSRTTLQGPVGRRREVRGRKRGRKERRRVSFFFVR